MHKARAGAGRCVAGVAHRDMRGVGPTIGKGDRLMKPKHLNILLTIASFLSMLLATGTALAQQDKQAPGRAIAADKARVIEHWSQARRALAKPRDLVIDSRGLGYLRGSDGVLQPYGHQIAAEVAGGRAAPSASSLASDTTPPSISNMIPAAGATIGASQAFSAIVTDADSGVRSVSFVIQYPDGVTTQTFSASRGTNDVWSVSLQGFSDGNWSWWVEARDGARRGGNRTTSELLTFTVDTSSGGSGSNNNEPPSGDTVTNAIWSAGGDVQTAAGRIYFEMPNNAKRKGPWVGYVCSGTVVLDGAGDRSIILTAAHCVYDDVNGAFARNVLFIPNQAGTSGSGTDLNCGNDPLGCWVPSFGVVDENWTRATFPENIEWDYAYYVVSDSGAHVGASSSSDSLEDAVSALPLNFNPPTFDSATRADFTHALGYSYSDDPKLMYCAEDMTTEGAVNWWLPNCGLSGGSSGGPWVQPMDASTGSGPVISVNSWGYTTTPGMAGPKLADTSAECIFASAKEETFPSASVADGDSGYSVICP